MLRLPALTLLIALVLPYARAPLCQAGAHEHEEGQMMAHHEEDVVSGPDSDIDCHTLMACQVGADLVAITLGPAAHAALGPTNDRALPTQSPPNIRFSPEVPPPRAI